MSQAADLLERAKMFDQRAERAGDRVSKEHYREMASHYRVLSVEHQSVRSASRKPRSKAIPRRDCFWRAPDR